MFKIYRRLIDIIAEGEQKNAPGYCVSKCFAEKFDMMLTMGIHQLQIWDRALSC